MPSIDLNDMAGFFAGFSAKFNAEKLAAEFPTAADKAALQEMAAKIDAAIKANQDAEKTWETLGTAKSVALRLLKLAI